MSHCHCGEFDRPTIAPDEFGETCFHERDKCEVPPVTVPIETVLRLTRARAEKAEAERDELRAQVQRVVDLHWPRADAFDDRVYTCGHCGRDWPCPTNRALNGESDE